MALAYEVLDNKKIEEQCTNLKIDEGVLLMYTIAPLSGVKI